MRTMNGMAQDLKATNQQVSKEEQVLNVIQALLNIKNWESFKLLKAHNESIKTFEAISTHLEMEDECLKSLAPSSVAFVGKVASLKVYRGKQTKKGPHTPQNSWPKARIAKKQKAKSNGEKNITHLNYYNFGKKVHFAPECPKPTKLPSFTKTLEIYLCSNVFVVYSLP